MRRYVIYAALVVAALVLLNLLAPLVAYGSNALVRNPNLSPFNPSAMSSTQNAPAPVLSADSARGQALYRTYCIGCHAPEAKFGPVQNSTDFQAKYADTNALIAVIRNGRAPMPSFPNHTLSDADLTDVIAYVRTLK